MQAEKPVRRIKETAWQVTFLPDGKRVLLIPWPDSHTLHIWSEDSEKPALTIKDPHGRNSQGFSMAVLAEKGKLLTISNSEAHDNDTVLSAHVAVWEADTGKRVREF